MRPARPNLALFSLALVLVALSSLSSVLAFGDDPVASVLSALAALIWLTLAVLELRKIRANNSNSS